MAKGPWHLSYRSPSLSEMEQRTMAFVDRILRGAKLAGLPVEQPTKFDLLRLNEEIASFGEHWRGRRLA
jgi:hypothetical protein